MFADDSGSAAMRRRDDTKDDDNDRRYNETKRQKLFINLPIVPQHRDRATVLWNLVTIFSIGFC